MAYLLVVYVSKRTFVIQVAVTSEIMVKTTPVPGTVVILTMNVKRLAYDYRIKVNRKKRRLRRG